MTTVTFEGDPARAYQFVAMLKDEGLDVDWTPPTEYRGGGDPAAVQIAINIVSSTGTLAIVAGVRAAVAKFRARNRGPTIIRIDGGRDEMEADDGGPP